MKKIILAGFAAVALVTAAAPADAQYYRPYHRPHYFGPCFGCRPILYPAYPVYRPYGFYGPRPIYYGYGPWGVRRGWHRRYW